MYRSNPKRLLCLAIASLCILPVYAQDTDAYKRTNHVVYREKHGSALTMDIFQPKENANGKGIIFCVSGGWYSARFAGGNPIFVDPLIKEGYTVFAVVHGSQPKYTIPEILEDMHRAVRFIRHHAEKYKVDPDKLGITGGSAGGHLSLMQGMAGTKGNPDAQDPIERESSRVQAVACFFPPTDFLNYGKPGQEAIGTGILKDFAAPFDFKRWGNNSKRFERITSPERRQEIGREISPINHVSSDDPPTLIIHGDADLLVPHQQAEILIEKLKENGIPNQLVTKPGKAHGWEGIDKDASHLVDWFNKHL